MVRDLSFTTALEAEKVLKEVGITALPVDPIEIARHYNITVAPKPVDSRGVSGMLIRVSDFFAIGYATHISNDGFQRFSVAHELGHFFLPGHIDAVLGDGDVHQSRAGFVSRDRFEEEADHFAANLLMPKRLFTEALRKSGSGLEAVERLSSLCRTSLLATAIRYSQCTPDPAAVIVSIDRSIDYCFMSGALKELKGIDWIKKRQAVPSGTPTSDFNKNPSNVDTAARVSGTSDVQDWFGGQRSIEVSEDVVGLGGYGKTLTILYDIEIPDPEEEEDEESLQDSWTPRFRR